MIQGMIRRNILPVLALGATLAVGICLGAGPLHDGDSGRTSPERAATTSAVSRERADAADSFVKAAAGPLTARRLAGQRVAVVAMPGAAEDVVSALAARVRSAGGAVSSVVRIRPATVDPAREAYADSLATQLAAGLRGRGVDGSLPTYQRLGQVIGFTYAAEQPAAALDVAQASSARTLTAAKLVASRQATSPATLILLVLGPGDRHVAPAVLDPLVEGIGGATRRLVAVGDSASAARGDLAALRRQKWGPWFASVDGVETTVGQVAATLALVRQIGRGGGSFGASGFDGLISLG